MLYRILALALLLTSAVFAADQRPPNILLILADDLGWGDVGFNGRREWDTPHLDRLAAQGTIFSRWYTGAVVCAPSRGVLLTGRYTIHNGVSANNDDLPSEEVTIAEALRERGYATALFGKWHHGRPRGGGTFVHPLDQGFDEFFGFLNAQHAWEKFPKELWFGREKKPVDGYASTLFTDRSIAFMREHRDRPFFLYVPYTESHFHIEAEPADVARFRGKFRESGIEPYNATYAAMVWRLDHEIGRLLAALDELSLADNTLVIFTSDHGATFESGNRGTSAYHDSNRPFRGGKRKLWEGGIRVPAVARWPGQVPAGRTCEEVIHMIDVLPTLCAAAGQPAATEWQVDGVDALDVWRGRGTLPERTLFWEWRSEGAQLLAAMRGRLKLVVQPGLKPELYDVVNDPAERRDLAAQYPEVVKQLQRQIEAWLATARTK